MFENPTDRCERILKMRKEAAEQKADALRATLSARCPRLQEIDDKLKSTGTQLITLILSHDDKIEEKVAEMEKNNRALLKEQDVLLEKMGYAADAMEPKYTCQTCSDTGWTKEGKRCSCFYNLLRLEAFEKLASESPLQRSTFEEFDLTYYSAEKDADGFSPALWMKQIFEICRKYADQFSPSTSKGLLFIGKTGLGKTHLALSIADVCIKNGFAVVYDSCQNLMRKLEREQFGKEWDTDLFQTLIDCDLLILDDLGTEFYTSFVASMLYALLNSRISAGLPTIISTNLTTEEVQEKYGDRIFSRIFSSCDILSFRGEDIRIRKQLQSRKQN